MGGLGSGRVSSQHKEIVEHARFIQSEWVKARMGVLNTRGAIKVSWKRGGQPYGEAEVALVDQRLHIVYRKRSGGETQWQDVHEVVELSYSAPHFGGKRLWLPSLRASRCCALLQRGGCLPKVFASFLSNGERRCNRSFTFKSSKNQGPAGGRSVSTAEEDASEHI